MAKCRMGQKQDILSLDMGALIAGPSSAVNPRTARRAQDLSSGSQHLFSMSSPIVGAGNAEVSMDAATAQAARAVALIAGATRWTIARTSKGPARRRFPELLDEPT